MKKIFTGILLGCLLTSLTITYAKPITKQIEVIFGSVNLEVNGKKVDKETILYNDTTYVPLRDAAEMLNMYVDWEENTNTAKISTTKPVATADEDKNKSISSFNAAAKQYLSMYPDANLLDIELQLSGGKEYYKVSGFDSTYERDVTFSLSGEVISKENEKHDDDDYDDFYDDDERPFSLKDMDSIIPYEKAIENAIAKMGNAVSKSDIEDIKLYNHTKYGMVYKIDFDDTKDHDDFEIKIDAISGDVLKIDD